MKAVVLLLCSWAIASPCFAATLMWDAQPSGGGALIVEKSPTATGPFTTVATVPQGTTQFVLTPGAWGFYQVRNSAGPSNVVQFSLDQYTGDVTVRLDKLETDGVALKATDAMTAQAIAGWQAKNATLETRVTTLEAADVALKATDANITKSVIDLQSGVIDLQSGLTTLMGRVGVLETVPVVTPPPPPATVNITAKQIDANNIEITGLNCTSLKTSGTGKRRNVQCVP